MAGRRRSGKADEWKKLKDAQDENAKLKKEVTKLRRLANANVVDTLQEKSKRLERGEPAIIREPVCERCGNPTIDVIPIKRADGKFKIEVCRSCHHRTNLKPI